MMNQLKTVLLLGLLTGVLLWVGHLIGGMDGLVIALIFAVVMNFVSVFFSDKLVLAMYRAKEVDTSHEAYHIVKDVVHLAGLPMPKVFVYQNANPNAFATGRSPKHAAVAFSTGILDLLNKEELKGVIAHEISHVKNRDILISAVAATIAGVISMVAYMARWGAIFGGFGGRDRNNNVLEFLVLAIVTPIIAMLIQLAISRSREYLADESAAKLLHNPNRLADALEKLKTGVRSHPLRPNSATQSTAHLFIANPFTGNGLFNLLSTHPPLDDRIKKLRNMSV